MADPILSKPHFQSEDAARDYLESLRWPSGPVCPHCATIGDHYKLEGESHRAGLWKCKDCREQFTVTVGTVFERSKVKLHVWLQAVHKMSASKKGISAHQLHRELCVTYKTAWFMAHRIREAMKEGGGGLLGGGGRTVEADETFWGNNKRVKGTPGRGYAHKMKVMSLVERGGKVRSFHVPDVTANTVREVLQRNVHLGTTLMTDEASQYTKPGMAFADHQVVRHSAREYARGSAHTNTIEGFFSILKRGLIGTFHHVGEQHLKRYVTEFDFRYNYRNLADSERSDMALKGVGGKRLTYR